MNEKTRLSSEKEKVKQSQSRSVAPPLDIPPSGAGSGASHTARAVPMSWALLRAQQACRARRSRAQRAQVARIGPRSWAHVATSFPCPVLGQVATSFLVRDLLDD